AYQRINSGGIGAALATGERGGIAETDAQAMRDSGLAHLLSVSGLHVTAVVGAAWLLTVRLLGLFPALALRVPLPLVAALGGLRRGCPILC
ncbi:MAG TPA: ComEC/Rec2 family competence protein, partial [Novosphingobium sp.]|nr:ComEC/Rec2 family competence protein [Novosphingobium sp.]